MDISIGKHVTTAHTVGEADTALALGSGDMEVLATPRLVAWLEGCTVQLCGSDETRTSVGVRVEVDHLRASKVGTKVSCTAEVFDIEGRNVVFKVTATQVHDGDDVLVGRGLVTRVVVERQRFLDRL